MTICTSQDFWLEQSLPLWAHAEQNRDEAMITNIKERLDSYTTDETVERLGSYSRHKYSVFKEGVAYCAYCGISLEYVEGKESYE